MPRRSKLEILINILESIYRGRNKPTHIMYRANLSWNRMNKYLDFLLRHGLIEEVEKGDLREYQITEKGKKIIWYFSKIKETMEISAIESNL